MKYQFPMIVWAVLGRLKVYLLKPFRNLKSCVICLAYGVECRGGFPKFLGKTIVRTRRRGDIQLGCGVVFDADLKNNLVGLTNPTILDSLPGGHISIGNYSGFSSVVISARSCIKIGDRVKCGGNVRIFDHDFHSINPIMRANPSLDYANVRANPVCIGDDVFIGTNTIILKGTSIGERSIVAAGSVIFGLDVPPDSLVKGNPASVISKVKK